jgi:surface protein
MGPGVLRAITGPRGPRGAETLAEKWSRLSRAEQIALGGTLMAALAGGGWLLSGGARSGGGGGGATHKPAQEPEGPLDSTNKADFRTKETSELLALYDSDASKRAEIAEFCACRIHDVRDLLLDTKLVGAATEIIFFHLERITKIHDSPGPEDQLASCPAAQMSFLFSAVAPNASFISSSLGPRKLNAAPTFGEHRFGTAKSDLFDEFLAKGLPADQSEALGIDPNELLQAGNPETDEGAFDDISNSNKGVVSEYVPEHATDERDAEGSDFSHQEREEAEVSGQDTDKRETEDENEFNEFRLDRSGPAKWSDDLKNKKRAQWETEKIVGALPHLTRSPDPTFDPNHSVYGHVSNHSVYGHVSTWDVRGVTTMKGAFAHAQFHMSEHIADMSFWDTRRVVDMSDMFFEARMFNGDITNWDTRNVRNMSNMFEHATDFNQNVGQWDTSKVIDMSSMFAYAEKFNQNLSNWVVQHGVKHDDMFDGSSMETAHTMHPRFEDTSSFGRPRKAHAVQRAYV